MGDIPLHTPAHRQTGTMGGKWSHFAQLCNCKHNYVCVHKCMYKQKCWLFLICSVCVGEWEEGMVCVCVCVCVCVHVCVCVIECLPLHTHTHSHSPRLCCVSHYVVYGTTLVSVQFTYIHTAWVTVNNIVQDIYIITFTGNNTWFIPTPLCGNTYSPYLAYNNYEQNIPIHIYVHLFV